ncbi:MAG: hypothetical protein CR974_04460 [Gammaproteobacteria bacterium]|nr:MAG: hypothetical protein CR974_04460 [Gammaproteobacteria bacterium]
MNYNILSLDGGGSWSILQLLTLKEKYGDIAGHDILKKFDMVIANSGGSIVLAALAENWTLSQALGLFDSPEIRQQIFSVNSFWERFFPIDYFRLFISFGPKYSTAKKAQAFAELFPNINRRQMRELPDFIGNPELKLIVCAYDALNKRAKFFRSYGDSERFESVRLTEAIHASSNAPVQYFDFPAHFKDNSRKINYELWDGAVAGFNNPVTAGVIEAFKAGVDLGTVKVVSLGTGNKLMSAADKKTYCELNYRTQRYKSQKWNLLSLNTQRRYFCNNMINQANSILDDPPDWANYVTYMFLQTGGTEDLQQRFIRLSPLIYQTKNSEPAVKELVRQLYALDMDLTDRADMDLIKQCFTEWAAGNILNQPISYHLDKDDCVQHVRGDKYFADALAKW